MKHIGYINNAQQYEHLENNLGAMKKCGCSTIHVERPKSKKRTEWGNFIDSLSCGDSAVLHSFDNAFQNFNDMMFFLKYCSKMNIRIISLSDGLDTKDELFPENKTADTLALICRVFGKRDKASHDDLEAELFSDNFSDRMLKRHGLAINMYKAGYSVKEIMERIGYRSKVTVYNILHNYEVRMDYPSKVRTKSKPVELAV